MCPALVEAEYVLPLGIMSNSIYASDYVVRAASSLITFLYLVQTVSLRSQCELLAILAFGPLYGHTGNVTSTSHTRDRLHA